MRSLHLYWKTVINFKAFALIIFISQMNFGNTLSAKYGGIVINGENHKPIENAIVQIAELKLYDVTDKNGKFEFKEVPPGKYHLIVSHVGFKTVNKNFEVKDKSSDLIIHLFPMAVTSEAVVVTGEHFNTAFEEIHEASNVLKGKDLQRELGLTLAATLKNETGLSVRSMGPAPARPVIRGLSGDRVLISEDGNKVNDLSGTSPDHALTVDASTANRIEVLRGPKVLTQTSTTIGGVVNLIREEIPETIPQRIIGSAGILGESVNSGFHSSLSTEIPIKDFVLKGELIRKSASDLNTPIGDLQNSDIKTFSFSGGIGLVKDWGILGASIREYDSEYGIPGGFVGAHPFGVDISMFKRQINAKFGVNFKNNYLKSATLDFNRSFYDHKEFEKIGAIGAEFRILNYISKLKVNHSLAKFNEGIFGVSGEFKDFNIGGFVFTPPSKSTNFSAFLYESFTFDNLDIQTSIRFDNSKVVPEKENPNSKIGFIRTRHFNSFSASGSLIYSINNLIFIGTNLSRSSRIPTIEELFSEGPHLAAYSYETGNPDLNLEKGYGSEIFVYYKQNGLFALVNLFYNDLSYYIIPRNTGKINFSTLLPVFATSGVPATLKGIEIQSEINFFDNFLLGGTLSYTDGKIKSTDSPLPAIPPLKASFDLRFSKSSYQIGINAEIVSDQKKVDQFEFSTAGYAIAGTYFQYSFPFWGTVNNLVISVENIFNKEFRNHLSRVKSIMPEAGRNFKASYRLFF